MLYFDKIYTIITREKEIRMSDKLTKNQEFLNMDTKEIELPETTYIRDIDSKVFQGIVLQSLAKIEGIGLIEGNIIDSLLGRDVERVKGIFVEQDSKSHSVFIRVEINILYGISIPEKAEEIQNKIIEAITTYTGLHVSCVHVIFKNLILKTEVLSPAEDKKESENLAEEKQALENEYSHGF